MRLGLFGALVALALIVAACGSSKPKPATTSATTTLATTLPSGPRTTSSSAGVPFEASVVTPTQTPKANVSWPYVVRVTSLRGKPIKATITVQVVDPLQQAHPVEYDRTTRKLVNWPINGVFRDDVIWPADSRGFPLTFRVIVTAKGGTRRLVVPVSVQ